MADEPTAEEWLRRYQAAGSDEERLAVREQLRAARERATRARLQAAAADDALAGCIRAIDKLMGP